MLSTRRALAPRLAHVLAAGLVFAASFAARAQAGPDDASLHAQATYVAQRKPSFPSPYEGPESLSGRSASSYSFTTTMFAGHKLWSGAEGYADLEAVQGVPLSNLSGLGGFSNGELQKTAGPSVRAYVARAFVRQTVGFGGGIEVRESGANQAAGTVDRRRLVVTVGKMAATDFFDDNRFAHDPRSDFLNWSAMDAGAYDYAADARGYDWGAVAEWFDAGWSLAVGRFLEPRESNGLALDPRLFRHFGDQIQLGRTVSMGGHEGKVRLLLFRNRAVMGAYRDALALGRGAQQPPDLALVRCENHKAGAVLNVEHDIDAGIGIFARASWNDGRTETYSFTEIDRSLAAGLVVDGARWHRAADEMAIALVRNGLSSPHRQYLAAGGHGFFLGDGRLAYGPERIVEAYYAIGVGPGMKVSVDVQRIGNPGYNEDRGPVTIYGLRWHGEF